MALSYLAIKVFFCWHASAVLSLFFLLKVLYKEAVLSVKKKKSNQLKDVLSDLWLSLMQSGAMRNPLS